VEIPVFDTWKTATVRGDGTPTIRIQIVIIPSETNFKGPYQPRGQALGEIQPAIKMLIERLTNQDDTSVLTPARWRPA
jgi:hypothetical protein